MRVPLALAAATLAGGVAVNRHYRRWLADADARSHADSEMRHTARGQVEFDDRGAGPPVLHFHGGNLGHPGWFTVGDLVDRGHRLITPDRPGYLGTPLGDNGDPRDQADLFAALLDELGIDRVAVLGVSAGGPGAVEFAVRYRERTTCLVLLSALTAATQLTSDQLNSALGRLVMSKRFQDPAYFLIHQAMLYATALALRDFAKTETTYPPGEAQRIIEMIVADPAQLAEVKMLADAIVPATPRYDGVTNDLRLQTGLDPLPLGEVDVPTLICHSRHDGDVPYESAVAASAGIDGAELYPVDQFGHFIWWGDGAVRADLRARVAAFVDDHARTGAPVIP